jgi:hypothetical protein
MTAENGEPTIILGSGTLFDYRCPEEAELTIADVAFGLAAASRFAGQAIMRSTGRRVRYNVAEHCVRMCDVAPPELRYPALMHELGEATCGDMNSPLKRLCPDYKAVEKRCEAAAIAWFAVPMTDEIRAAVKLLDLRMCVTEKLYLRPAKWTDQARAADAAWNAGHPPLDIVIGEPWSFDEAAHEFLKRFGELAPPEIAEREGVFVL